MLTRIVKLTIATEKASEFEHFFKEHKHIIQSFEGCNHVELLKSKDEFFFTYSLWKNERLLEAYRHSKEFNEIWNETKSFFSGKPEAWSLHQIEDE